MDQFWDETEPDVMSVVVRVLPSILPLPSLVSKCKQQFVGGSVIIAAPPISDDAVVDYDGLFPAAES